MSDEDPKFLKSVIDMAIDIDPDTPEIIINFSTREARSLLIETHKNTFWKLTCSCGVTVTYPLDGLPTVDTPHPCNNPNHWTVRYEDQQPRPSLVGLN